MIIQSQSAQTKVEHYSSLCWAQSSGPEWNLHPCVSALSGWRAETQTQTSFLPFASFIVVQSDTFLPSCHSVLDGWSTCCPSSYRHRSVSFKHKHCYLISYLIRMRSHILRAYYVKVSFLGQRFIFINRQFFLSIIIWHFICVLVEQLCPHNRSL